MLPRQAPHARHRLSESSNARSFRTHEQKVATRSNALPPSLCPFACLGRVAFAYHDRVNIAPLHYVVAAAQS
jgi:hypothetical protein